MNGHTHGRIRFCLTVMFIISEACAIGAEELYRRIVDLSRGSIARISHSPIKIQYSAEYRVYLGHTTIDEQISNNELKVSHPNVRGRLTTASGTTTETFSEYVESERGVPYRDQVSSVTIVSFGDQLFIQQHTTSPVELRRGMPFLVSNSYTYCYDGEKTYTLDTATLLDSKPRSHGSLQAGKKAAPDFFDPKRFFELPQDIESIKAEAIPGNKFRFKTSNVDLIVDPQRSGLVTERIQKHGRAIESEVCKSAHNFNGLWLPTEVSETRVQEKPVHRKRIYAVQYSWITSQEAAEHMKIALPASTATE